MPVAMEEVQNVLRRHIAEVLYCEPGEVGDETDFSDLGLDSVLSAELTAVVNREYGLRTDIEVIHQNPTLVKLAGYVTANAG